MDTALDESEKVLWYLNNIAIDYWICGNNIISFFLHVFTHFNFKYSDNHQHNI